MPRMKLSAALLTVTLLTVAHGGAEAQVVALASYIEFDTFIDLTHTANGQSIRCRSPEVVGGPRIVDVVLEPEVGASDVATQRFFCEGVAIDIYRELTVGEVFTIDGVRSPAWAHYYARVDVVYNGGVGDTATVYEHEDSLVMSEGTGGWPFISRINPVPGVVFHNLVDTVTDRLAP